MPKATVLNVFRESQQKGKSTCCKIFGLTHSAAIIITLGFAWFVDEWKHKWTWAYVCLWILGPLLCARIFLYFSMQTIMFSKEHGAKRWSRCKRNVFQYTPAAIISCLFGFFWFTCVFKFKNSYSNPNMIVTTEEYYFDDIIKDAENTNKAVDWMDFSNPGFKFYGFLNVWNALPENSNHANVTRKFSYIRPIETDRDIGESTEVNFEGRKKQHQLTKPLSTCQHKFYDPMIKKIWIQNGCAHGEGYEVSFKPTQCEDDFGFEQAFHMNLWNQTALCDGSSAKDDGSLSFQIFLNQDFFYRLITTVDGQKRFPYMFLQFYPHLHDISYGVSTEIPNYMLAHQMYQSQWTVREDLHGKKNLYLDFAREAEKWPTYPLDGNDFTNAFLGEGGDIYFPEHIWINFEGFYIPEEDENATLSIHASLEREQRQYDFTSFLSSVAGILSLAIAAFGFCFPDTLPVRYNAIGGAQPDIPGLEPEVYRASETPQRAQAGFGTPQQVQSHSREHSQIQYYERIFDRSKIQACANGEAAKNTKFIAVLDSEVKRLVGRVDNMDMQISSMYDANITREVGLGRTISSPSLANHSANPKRRFSNTVTPPPPLDTPPLNITINNTPTWSHSMSPHGTPSQRRILQTPDASPNFIINPTTEDV